MDKKWYQKGLDWLLEKDKVGKKWYKRRIVWLIAVVVIVLVVLLSSNNSSSDSNKNTGKYEIPNVFGVYYEDAVDVLEAEGFEVKAIEADAKSTFHNLYEDENADLRPKYLEKGSVFKVDDYTQRGDGCLMKNDDIMFDGIFSNDKSIVLYYAKDAYSGNENATPPSAESEITPTPATATSTESEAESTPPPTPAPEKEETESSEIRKEFKDAMDSYEDFFDEYVAIMNKYAENPGDMSILADYTKYIGEYAQMMKDFEDWEDKDMNAAELAYYIEVQGRITKKLLEVAQ